MMIILEGENLMTIWMVILQIQRIYQLIRLANLSKTGITLKIKRPTLIQMKMTSSMIKNWETKLRKTNQ